MIKDIDKRLVFSEGLTEKNIDIYSALDERFTAYGITKPQKENELYYRLPKEVAKTVSESVLSIHSHTAGGRIRFATDSDYIAIHAKMDNPWKLANMSLSSTAGFDLYRTEDGVQKHIKAFIPPTDIVDGFSTEVLLPEKKMYEYTLYMPIFAGIYELDIILREGSKLEKASGYKYDTPVVFYGSSITHGACVSRPGIAYSSIISQTLDCDYLNLGFCGCAKAEDEMAQYIATLNMSVFVYDYDYNAETYEELNEHHEKMFKIIREKKPELPIICVSRPDYSYKPEESEQRIQCILKTVNNAIANGDKNVYFINGNSFFDELPVRNFAFVDGCHPNDLGNWCMAQVIGKKIKELLK